MPFNFYIWFGFWHVSIKWSITTLKLCVVAGMRLWPVSRGSFPKQFATLVGEKRPLEPTLARVAQHGAPEEIGRVMCVAAQEHCYLVSAAMQTCWHVD
jgi:mannose-1-phosphate guanylyltransferase/mannose-6-phosphate isomerase